MYSEVRERIGCASRFLVLSIHLCLEIRTSCSHQAMVATMNDNRVPKQLLFGWLPKTHPAHGPQVRWRDRARLDLKSFELERGHCTRQHKRADFGEH